MNDSLATLLPHVAAAELRIAEALHERAMQQCDRAIDMVRRREPPIFIYGQCWMVYEEMWHDPLKDQNEIYYEILAAVTRLRTKFNPCVGKFS